MKTNQPASKVAIVTGASRGIGAAIAQRLARDGYAVVINYAGNATEAGKVAEAIAEDGADAVAVQGDVSRPRDVGALFDRTIAAFGRVDVLVNNAGIMPPSLPSLADTDDETFDRLFAVNVKGTFNTLREAARRMTTGGRIVNFSTSVIGLALPGYAVYGATKGAVEVFTNIMAKELRGRNIRVNAVAPDSLRPIFSPTAKPRSRSRISRKCRRSNASANRRTSPRSPPSSPAPTPAGSTAKPCAPTAASSDSSHTNKPNYQLNQTMKKTWFITGTSRGFGATIAKAAIEAATMSSAPVAKRRMSPRRSAPPINSWPSISTSTMPRRSPKRLKPASRASVASMCS